MTELERAILYIQAAGGAISGAGGHNHTYGLACNLFKNFPISEEDVLHLLQQYHNPTCDPPWSDKELRHKVNDAARATAGLKPKPSTNIVNMPKPEPSNKPKFEHVFGVSKRPMPEEMEGDTASALLRSCFREGEGVRIAIARLDDHGKEVPDEHYCFSREDWLAKLKGTGGKVNGTGGFFVSSGNPGIYISINPLEIGKTRDADVSEFRHALLEFDELSIDKQWELYRDSEIPIAALIHSGKRSLHAWVKVDAKDRKEYDERVKVLYDYFEEYRPDTKNKNPGRLSRMVGCIRMDSRQKLLELDMGKSSFTEWMADRELDGIGKPLSIDGLLEFDPKADESNVLGNRWLCKGGSFVLVGPSGVGKSTIEVQAIINFALGQSFFGVTPVKPLRSLVIQAENDEGDIAEMFQGVLKGLGISKTDKETIEQIKSSVVIVRNSSQTGEPFVRTAQKLIDRHSPDLVWMDPVLSFIGDDISKQDVCSKFFRNLLAPVLEATGAVLMCVHHTGKPPKERQQRRNSVDVSYDGLGSSDLTNWARAVCKIDPVGTQGDTFELIFAKRGGRAGAKDLQGQPTRSVWLKHSTDGLNWIQIEKPDWVEGENESKPPGKPGRKSKDFPMEKFLHEVKGLSFSSTKKLVSRACDISGISASVVYEKHIDDIKSKMKQDAETKEWTYEETLF